MNACTMQAKIRSGRENTKDMLRRSMAGEQRVVTVPTQGRTENGQLWAARFEDLRTDKAPEACVE